MSRVPYTINVDRFICTELQDIREMMKVLDFSRLAATIERIQHHAQAMEDALYDRRDNMSTLQNDLDKLVEELKEEKISQVTSKVSSTIEEMVKKSRKKD